MNTVVKVTRLDLMIMKSFWKYLLLYLALPLCFLFTMRSLPSGLLTAMCFMSLAALMIFQTEESSGGAEMNAFLPVTTAQRVAGRYLTVFAVGAAGMVCSLLLQWLMLTVMDAPPAAGDVAVGVMLASAFFLAMTAVQLPCVYGLGAIKGRVVSIIAVGLTVALVVLLSSLRPEVAAGLGDNIVALAAAALAAGAVLFVGSAFLSVRIAGRKK